MPDFAHSQNRVIVFIRTVVEIFLTADVPGKAQAIAYNILFSIAPLLIFLTAFCSLVIQRFNAEIANPVEPVLDWLDQHLPPEAAEFLKVPVETALTTPPEFLLSFGGLLTLWAAKNAIGATIKGLNATYGITESRSYFKVMGTAILMTVGLAVSALIAALLQVLSTNVGQDIADWFGLGTQWEQFVAWAQWPVTALLAVGVTVMIHRVGPDFHAPIRWLMPGAAFTIIAFVIATWALQFYFSHFPGYSAAYGIFGAVLAFIFWMFVVSLIVLVGGVLNATLFRIFPPACHALERYNSH